MRSEQKIYVFQIEVAIVPLVPLPIDQNAWNIMCIYMYFNDVNATREQDYSTSIDQIIIFNIFITYASEARA